MDFDGFISALVSSLACAIGGGVYDVINHNRSIISLCSSFFPSFSELMVEDAELLPKRNPKYDELLGKWSHV